MSQKIVNIIKSIIKHPFVIASKIKRRFTRKLMFQRKSTKEYNQWLEKNSVDYKKYFSDIDPKLFGKAREFEQKFSKAAEVKLENIDVQLGGGGIYPILYFLTLFLEPETIVETGVAAGFSSTAFLKAISEIDQGQLYSSDLPYIRLDNPEKYIGLLVDDNLKDNWELYIEGDRTNLPKIANKVSHIDIFHYDSDKSYEGREFAMSFLEDKFTKDTTIIMDDIEGNTFFRDYVAKKNINKYKIFQYQGKYVGLIGNRKLISD